MPATNLPVNTITRTGAAPVTEIAADNVNGNQLATNNGVTTWVEATNTTASATTVTVQTPNTVDGLAIGDKVYSFAATAGLKLRMGPFPIDIYGAQPLVTASAVTVTLAAYQI